MTDLTLQEKKQLLLDAIQTVDQITEEIKENVPFTDTEEQWEAKQYKSFLVSKLGAIEVELESTDEDTNNTTEETTTTEEGNEEQVTQQETINNTEQNKDEKDEEEEEKVKP